MAINPNKNIKEPSFLQSTNELLSDTVSLQQLSHLVHEVSLEILGNSLHLADDYVLEVDKKLFKKFSDEDLVKLLDEKEKQALDTSRQSIDLLLDRIKSKESEEPSSMEDKGIRFLDIDRALGNASKQLQAIKQTVFPEWEAKLEVEKNVLAIEKENLLKEKRKIKQSLETVDLLLDFVENSQQEGASAADTTSLSSLFLEKLFLEEEDTAELATQATNDLVASLLSIRNRVSFSPEETKLFSDKLFQLQDSSSQCIRTFSQLTAFTKACTLFLRTTPEAFFREKQAESEKEKLEVDGNQTGGCCQRIKEMFCLAQRKLVNFGKFIRQLFIQLFSFLASSCSSACMCPLVILRRKKADKDVKFVENLFVEGKLSFGPSSIAALSRLKLFLKLFGLELLVYTEEGDVNYSVVIDISDKALENLDTLSNIMLALAKYFENFSFENFLFEIDRLPDVQAREVEEILASRLEELFSHQAWIFFEGLGLSENS